MKLSRFKTMGDTGPGTQSPFAPQAEKHVDDEDRELDEDYDEEIASPVAQIIGNKRNSHQVPRSGKPFEDAINESSQTERDPLDSSMDEFVSSGKNNSSAIDWAMKIGKMQDQAKEETIEQLKKPSDSDVYPLSVTYNDTQKIRMKIIRIIAFILCFYFVIPFDLYIKTDYRLYFYGTEVHETRIPFNISNSSFAFTFNIRNCRVGLWADPEPANDSFKIEYGFKFQTNYSISMANYTLNITADQSQTCIVNVYLPPSSPLPTLNFNMTGVQDNMLFWDQTPPDVALNFSNGLSIVGDSVFVSLNNHHMSYFNVDSHFAIIELRNITCMKKNITAYSGLYNEILKDDANIVNVTIEQPDGNICLWGPTVTQIDNTQCDIINSFNNTNATYSSCVLSTYICLADGSPCNPAQGTQVPYSYIKIVDGPVQFRFPDSSPELILKYDSLYQFDRPATSMAVSSYKMGYANADMQKLNDSSSLFITDQANDRIQVLQHIGLGYDQTWVYTNKKQLLQAQYWPLTWGSGGLLTPQMDSTKILMVDYMCPARASNDLTLAGDVAWYLYQYYPTTTTSQVAFISGYSEFNQIQFNSFNEPLQSKILMNDNQQIVNCFAIAVAIALVGAIFGVQLTYMGVKTLKVQYDKFLKDQKQLAITGKQTKESKKEGNIDLNKILQNFEGFGKVYENRGLFKTELLMDQELILNEKLEFRFSLFQIPALLLDHIFRQKIINSLSQFLLSINYSKLQFTSKKMKQYDKTDVSMPVYEFQTIYSDFCQKEGYFEIQIQEESTKSTLVDFDLVIEDDEGRQESAYVNIRFMTPKEKIDSKFNSDSPGANHSVYMFLMTQCIQSKFDTDYISFQELKHKYNHFCQVMGIQESKREQIIGSDHLVKFGSVVDLRNPPKRIIGVKVGRPDKPASTPDTFGLIRIPCSISTSFFAQFTAIDGLLPNAAIAIVHFVLILVVPLVTPIVSFLALCHMTTLQQSIYALPLKFTEFFNVNRLDPWWDRTPDITIIEYIHIYAIVYLVFAYIEVLSFYLTGYDNNGKFPVKYSSAKKYFMFAFYLTLGVFLFIYVAMLWFVIVWALLAAILNPSVFLPYTAAALALLGTISAKLIFYRTKFEDLTKNFTQLIQEKIGGAFQKSMEIVQSKGSIQDLINIKLDPNVAHAQLTKGMSNLFSSSDSSDSKSQPSSSKPMPKFDVGNTVAALATQATKNIDGLDPVITQVLIAVITRDEKQISSVIKLLGDKLQVNGEFLETIVQFGLCSFNPARKEKQSSFGIVELACRRLFRVLAPELPIADKIGDICKVLFEKDPTPILNNFDLLIPKENKEKKAEAARIAQILKILSTTIKGKKSQIRQEFVNMVESLLKSQGNSSYFDTFRLLTDLRETDISVFLNESSKFDGKSKVSANLLGFKHTYPILCLSDVYTRSSTLSINVLINSIKEVLVDGEMLNGEEKDNSAKNFNTHLQKEPLTVSYFIGLLQVLKGSKIDVKSIAKEISKQNLTQNALDGETLECIHSISHGSQDGFEQIIFKLGCASSREILIEFFQMMQQKNVKFEKVCQKLKVQEIFKDTLTNLMYLLYLIMAYDSLQQHSNPNIKELQFLRLKVQKCLSGIKDQNGKVIKLDKLPGFEGLYTQKQADVNYNDGTPTNRVVPETSALLSLASLDEEEIIDTQIKGLVYYFFPDTQQQGLQRHQDLWISIMKKLEPQLAGSLPIFTDAGFQLMRNVGLMLMRVNKKLKPQEVNYQKAIKELAYFFEIPNHIFEFLMDTISDNPLDIFKLQNRSIITYNLRPQDKKAGAPEQSYQGVFDAQRISLLSNIAKGSPTLLGQMCFKWYHQFRYQEMGREAIDKHLIKSYSSLSLDFIEIIELYRDILSGEVDQSHERELGDKINDYLKDQIGLVIAQSQMNTPRVLENYQVTDLHFGPESSSTAFKIPETENTDIQAILQSAETMGKIQLLRHLDKRSLKKMTGDTVSKSKKLRALKSFLKVDSDPQPEQFLACLVILGDTTQLWPEKVNLLVPEEQLIHSQAVKAEFIALALLLNANQFTKMCRRVTSNRHIVLNSINNILALEDKYVPLEEKEVKYCLQSLHENSFLMTAECNLLKPISENLTPNNCNDIAELLIGTSTGDTKLTRSALMELLEPKRTDKDILEGLISVLVNDAENEESINIFCSKLDIDGQFVIQLMDLTHHNTQRLPQILMKFLESNSLKPENNLCQGLISLFKRDLSSARLVTLKLGIDHQKGMAAFAAATGHISILSEYYSLIQETLGLNSLQSVRYLMLLSHGHSDCITQLAGLNDDTFDVYDPDLTKAIFDITRLGNQIQNNKLQVDKQEAVSNTDSGIGIVTKKLCQTFDIAYEKTQHLETSVKILVKSCWNDRTSMIQLLAKLVQNVGSNSIWHDQDGGIAQGMKESEILDFIYSNLSKVITNHQTVTTYIQKTKKDLIQKLMTIVLPVLTMNDEEEGFTPRKSANKADTPAIRFLRAFTAKYQKDELVEREKFEKTVSAFANINSDGNKFERRVQELDSFKMINAFKVGCTFGTSQYTKIKQPIYICLTCTKDLGSDDTRITICKICALFCHNGHQIEQASDDLFIKDICNCGEGQYNGTTTINSRNPIASCQGSKKCSMLHKTYKSIVTKANDLVKSDPKNKGGSGFLSSYTPEAFLKDLQHALEYPDYFEGKHKLALRLQQDEIVSNQNGISYFMDSTLFSFKSVAENLILLASGNPTNSFVTIMSVKKEYESADHKNQDLVLGNENESSIAVYNGLNCLIALAQDNIEKFGQYAEGLCTVFNEVGTIEYSAVEKLTKVLLLSRGGDMPGVEEDIDSPAGKIFKNPYAEVIRSLFGIQWKSVIALHKCLTLSRTDLMDAMNLDSLDSSKSKASLKEKLEQNKDLNNMVAWVDVALFERNLKLGEESVSHCKSIIGLMSRHANALDYLAKEQNFSNAKARHIKALVFNKNLAELKPVFTRINRNIPESLSEQLRKLLCDEDSSQVVEFLTNYIIIKEEVAQGSWASEDLFDSLKADNNEYKEHLEGIRDYITCIQQLMSGNIQDAESQLTFIIKTYLSQSLYEEKEKVIDPALLPTYLSIFGLLNQDQQLASRLSDALDYKDFSRQLLDSIISIRKGKKSQKVIIDVCRVLCGIEIKQKTHKALILDCKQMQKALNGDIISLTSIVDKLANNDSHLRSLLASLVTGQTKFDSLNKDHEKQVIYRNLLLREVYRLLETAVKLDYSDRRIESDKVDAFINKCFRDKFPLYLVLLLTEEESLMDSLFDMETQFLTSLNSELVTVADKQYLKNFISFLDPFNAEASIKPLLEYLLKSENGTLEFEFPVFPCLLPKPQDKDQMLPQIIVVDKGSSFKADLLEFLSFVFNCISSDSITAISNLFDSFIKKSLDLNPMFEQIIQVQRGILEGGDISGALPALIQMIGRGMKVESGEQLDKLSKMVAQWFSCISNMLNKDNKVIANPTDLFKGAVNATMEYYGKRTDHVLGNKKEQINFLVDVVSGLTSLSRGDIKGIKPLALKLGGFPDQIDKLEQFVKVIQQNKDGLNLKGTLSTVISGSNVSAAANAISKSMNLNIPGGDVAISAAGDAMKLALTDPSKLFDPKNIFNHFANSRGVMGFDEFINMFKQLGLKLNHAQIMKLFSAADREKKGELVYTDFVKALDYIKSALVNELMGEMGVSILDMAIAFIMSIALLSLTLAFIFVGINAFAPASSFSSVTNTMLPLGAGGVANGKSDDEKKPEKLASKAT